MPCVRLGCHMMRERAGAKLWMHYDGNIAARDVQQPLGDDRERPQARVGLPAALGNLGLLPAERTYWLLAEAALHQVCKVWSFWYLWTLTGRPGLCPDSPDFGPTARTWPTLAGLWPRAVARTFALEAQMPPSTCPARTHGRNHGLLALAPGPCKVQIQNENIPGVRVVRAVQVRL